MMSAVWSVAVAVVLVIVGHLLGALASEEIYTRICRLPFAAIRLAVLAVPKQEREELRSDLEADLAYLLKETEGLPITKLWRGIRFAGSLLLRSHELSGRRTLGITALRVVGGSTALGVAGFWVWLTAGDWSDNFLLVDWQQFIGGLTDAGYGGWAYRISFAANAVADCASGLAFLPLVLCGVRVALWPEHRWMAGRYPLGALRIIWACVSIGVGGLAVFLETSFLMGFFSGSADQITNRFAFIIGLGFAFITLAGKMALVELTQEMSESESELSSVC